MPVAVVVVLVLHSSYDISHVGRSYPLNKGQWMTTHGWKGSRRRNASAMYSIGTIYFSLFEDN